MQTHMGDVVGALEQLAAKLGTTEDGLMCVYAASHIQYLHAVLTMLDKGPLKPEIMMTCMKRVAEAKQIAS